MPLRAVLSSFIELKRGGGDVVVSLSVNQLILKACDGLEEEGYLLNNEQLIQKLADSYPMRRAAQLTAYMFHRGKELGEESIEKLRDSDTMHRLQQEIRQTGQRASTFSNTFKKEVESGIKEMNEKLKKHSQQR